MNSYSRYIYNKNYTAKFYNIKFKTTSQSIIPNIFLLVDIISISEDEKICVRVVEVILNTYSLFLIYNVNVKP